MNCVVFYDRSDNHTWALAEDHAMSRLLIARGYKVTRIRELPLEWIDIENLGQIAIDASRGWESMPKTLATGPGVTFATLEREIRGILEALDGVLVRLVAEGRAVL